MTNIKLIVSEAFGGYERGQEIENQDEIQKILDSEHAQHVLKIACADDLTDSKKTK